MKTDTAKYITRNRSHRTYILSSGIWCLVTMDTVSDMDRPAINGCNWNSMSVVVYLLQFSILNTLFIISPLLIPIVWCSNVSSAELKWRIGMTPRCYVIVQSSERQTRTYTHARSVCNALQEIYSLIRGNKQCAALVKLMERTVCLHYVSRVVRYHLCVIVRESA